MWEKLRNCLFGWRKEKVYADIRMDGMENFKIQLPAVKKET
jgi:hypothetical protein